MFVAVAIAVVVVAVAIAVVNNSNLVVCWLFAVCCCLCCFLVVVGYVVDGADLRLDLRFLSLVFRCTANVSLICELKLLQELFAHALPVKRGL